MYENDDQCDDSQVSRREENEFFLFEVSHRCFEMAMIEYFCSCCLFLLSEVGYGLSSFSPYGTLIE